MVGKERIVDVYLALRGGLGRSVRGIVPPSEVEDIVQEIYVRVCQIESVREINDPRSFLFRTAHNLAIDFVRRSETRLSDSYDELPDYDLPEKTLPLDTTFDEVATNEEFVHFCEAVRHLSVKCRRAFVLRKVYGYSQREIAEEMEISESTVEKHIAHGITRCTYYMMRHGEGFDNGRLGNLARSDQQNIGFAGGNKT